MLSGGRAVVSRRLRQPNSFEPILRLLESRYLESTTFGLTRSQPTSRLLLYASRRRYSNPQLSRLFRNASPNATFPRTDYSSEADAATNASASLTDLANSTAAAT